MLDRHDAVAQWNEEQQEALYEVYSVISRLTTELGDKAFITQDPEIRKLWYMLVGLTEKDRVFPDYFPLSKDLPDEFFQNLIETGKAIHQAKIKANTERFQKAFAKIRE